ncbi:MAG: caspase family protein [Methyloceanibacter sp.]
MRRPLSTVLISLLLAAAVLPSPAAAKRLALVVGIDQYDNLQSNQQLKKAVGDAHAVGEAFRSLGYDVQQADNVSRLDFLRQWQRFLNRIEPGDEAALFFAGHGVEISGLNFLLPADVPRVNSGEEELLKASGLSLSGFLDQARERKPQMMLYVVDACRDNPFVNSNGRSIGGTRGLTLVEPPSGTFVMFSAGAGETALDRLSDDDPNPNSVYTRTLLPRLKEPGRIGDIARDVRRKVRDLASKVNHTQTPAFYDEVLGDFCPAGCTVEAKADATAPAKPQPTPPDPALEAWNATKNTDSVGVLSAYVAKFGNSFYAELAKARIEELKRKQDLAAAAPAKPQASGPDPALAAWSSVKDSDNVDVLETFIGSYPLSFYAELARVHLKELKNRQLADLVVPPARKVLPPPPDPVLEVWNATKNTDSVSVLEGFVGKYPESFYAEIAKAKIEDLKRKQLETAQQGMVQEIQRALKDIDCYGGAIDGTWSGGSREALGRFRRLAKLNPAPEDPSQATLDSLKAWKGDHCSAEKVAAPLPPKAAAPRKDKATPVVHPRSLGKAAKTPPARVAKKPQQNNNVSYDSPEKQQAAKKAGRTLEYDYGSVYCHQGCAGGFTSVLSGTATNPGMKR